MRPQRDATLGIRTPETVFKLSITIIEQTLLADKRMKTANKENNRFSQKDSPCLETRISFLIDRFAELLCTCVK